MGVTGVTEVMNTPRIIVRDDNATEPVAPAVPNEGTDTLVGIESVKFLNGTTFDTDDVTLMMSRRARTPPKSFWESRWRIRPSTGWMATTSSSDSR